MDVDFDPRYDASAVVVVEKLLPGGVGLARLPEGKLVLVEGAAAQDKLSIVYRIGRAKTLRGRFGWSSSLRLIAAIRRLRRVRHAIGSI